MIAGEVFRLFCAQAAAGILLILPLVPLDMVGRSFYKINVRVAVALLLLGHGCSPHTEGLALVSFVLGLLAAGAGFAYLRLLATKNFARGWPLLALAALLSAGSLGTIIGEAMTRENSHFTGLWSLLAGPCLLSGSALLGSVTLSMILGHYYLNYPKLPITPLKRYNLALLAAAFSRAAFFLIGIGVVYYLEVPGSSPDRGFFMDHVLILTQRVLFGVFGPCLLAWMSWETVKIKSTQSATGILYAAMVLVAIGELTGAWFQVTGGLSF